MREISSINLFSKYIISNVFFFRPHEASQNFDPVEVCPLLYTTRLSTSRMLIELEEWEKSVQVLDGLIEEDDEIVDTWYLLGKYVLYIDFTKIFQQIKYILINDILFTRIF